MNANETVISIWLWRAWRLLPRLQFGPERFAYQTCSRQSDTALGSVVRASVFG